MTSRLHALDTMLEIALLRVAALAALLLVIGSTPLLSQELKVATKELAPFAMKDDQGEWTGVSVEIWQEVADQAGLEYQWVEDDLTGILEGLESGNYQAAAAAITMTGEREQLFDFSHSYFSTGLGIAVPEQAEGGLNWYAVLKAFFTWQFFSALTALVVVLLAAGLALWFFERKRNPEQFGDEAIKGIGNGFWWSAVTMTTVGYGDKAPITTGGRFVALIWMFTSVIVVSSFTASIASSLTVGSIDGGIETVDDLNGKLVGTIEGSTSESFLDQGTRARVRGFDSATELLEALEDERIDAVVYDRAILQYRVGNYEQLMMLPLELDKQNYAMALNVSEEVKESINIALLNLRDNGRYEEILQRYGIK
ncbi:transporter substrate-binding domain-containing protein [Pelagicoccus sp. SDUM812003]|uniref:transporter substrate-binding domain-containing protein n=1 Tax=Pelagicoccus sp. SDUM812003 TaxID=3041267 RepID=UPI00280CF62B|nr:transporter substrate-binding domain-containing protein [Pelagicoccus sp. SDUM812003]MDQ8203853.1 transporter substrate-binding domain-containing protein [Pelagicoccus sp. SDUM812003]